MMHVQSAELCTWSWPALTLAIVLASVAGLLWALTNWAELRTVNLSSDTSEDFDGLKLMEESPLNIIEIGHKIKQGASEFIKQEYRICSLVVGGMATLIFFCVDTRGVYTSFAFCVGAFTSMACGGVSMHIATESNYRTTIQAKRSIGHAFNTAFKAGTVMGFAVVSVALLVLVALIILYKQLLGLTNSSPAADYYRHMFQTISGYGLGGSTVALFARVGGGIFTKAADVGADLVGKIEKDLPEDSPRNPATIADNVGDNVGDIAGMGADLFGSFAESSCAALVISCSSMVGFETKHVHFQNLFYPLLIPTTGLLVCILTTWYLIRMKHIQDSTEVEPSLKAQLVWSTVLLVPVLWLTSYICLPEKFIMMGGDGLVEHSYFDAYKCSLYGLLAGFIIGYFTQVMTSYSYRPVQQLAESCRTGAGTNVIYGLALGYLSTIVPVCCLCVSAYLSSKLLGYYGVALAAIGMLANLPICLAIDGYGPISDNAGGIAEMAELGEQIRCRTDALDSAGNTTAAIGKGFAIGSATLVALSLYGAYLHTTGYDLKGTEVSFNDPLVFACLLFGAMLPYAFSALTMKSVGKAALGMVREVRRQLRQNPGILEGLCDPDYKACVRISTLSSLKEMILPGLMVTLTPLILGYLYGPKAIVGFLPGAIVSGVQMAISASNTGGAWDNAKKYIEAGLLKDDEGVIVRKGSDIHKAAVVGDTVGDPLKDTSGPSLNILIKLMAIISLVFGHFFMRASAPAA